MIYESFSLIVVGAFGSEYHGPEIAFEPCPTAAKKDTFVHLCKRPMVCIPHPLGAVPAGTPGFPGVV